MKHLKLYESRAVVRWEDRVKLEIKNLLNNNLISDVKDMSLEYLDSGMILIIIVSTTSQGMLSPTHVRKFRSLEYKFSHKIDECKWILDNVTLPIRRLSYEFRLERHIPNHIIICDDSCKELYERVIMAYPNEDII